MYVLTYCIKFNCGDSDGRGEGLTYHLDARIRVGVCAYTGRDISIRIDTDVATNFSCLPLEMDVMPFREMYI